MILANFLINLLTQNAHAIHSLGVCDFLCWRIKCRKKVLNLNFFRKFIFIGMRKEILPLAICCEDLLVQNTFFWGEFGC